MDILKRKCPFFCQMDDVCKNFFEVKYKKGKCAGDGTGRKLKQKEA